MKDYTEIFWMLAQDSWHTELHSLNVSIYTITSEDFNGGDEGFFFPHHYDVSLIFNI